MKGGIFSHEICMRGKKRERDRETERERKSVCVLITKYAYNTWTILVISWMSMTPFPSTSYIRKAHFSFSSGVPLDVTSIANKNSCNEQNWTLLLLSVSLQLKKKKGFWIYWSVKSLSILDFDIINVPACFELKNLEYSRWCRYGKRLNWVTLRLR